MDILKRIEELQDLFDEDEVTTADKINRPEPKQSVKEIELFNEFNTRNPKAEGGRIPFGDGSITKVQQLTEAVRKSPRLVKLFNEGNLYHIRTTIGGSESNRINYRGTKEELKNILKKRQSTGKPIKLTDRDWETNTMMEHIVVLM